MHCANILFPFGLLQKHTLCPPIYVELYGNIDFDLLRKGVLRSKAEKYSLSDILPTPIKG